MERCLRAIVGGGVCRGDCRGAARRRGQLVGSVNRVCEPSYNNDNILPKRGQYSVLHTVCRDLLTLTVRLQIS